MSDKQIIPLFPLPLVVCPGELLPLHIFEDRYKQMIAFCRGQNEDKQTSPFGVSLAYNNKLYNIGCSVRIEEIVKEYGDGRLDITTVGLMRYKMLEIYKDLPYIRASVEFFDDDDPEPFDLMLRERAIALHQRLNELVKGEAIQDDFAHSEQTSFQITHSAGFDVVQKQRILEMTSENQRLHAIVTHFERVIPDIEKAEEIKRRVLSNGHFKNLRSSDI
ncbi:MAG: ATP-dependent protease [Chlorobiales bacterium]|nr:ATP-dependent protease [Chlorobiales bacterium]